MKPPGEIRWARLLAVGLGRNDGSDPALLETLDECVGVITLVGDDGLGLDRLEQRLGLRDVGRLPRRQRERDRIAEIVDNSVDFRRQAATRATDGLVLAVFFWAPALCWCARTMVASSIANSLSASRASVSKIRANTPLTHHRR